MRRISAGDPVGDSSTLTLDSVTQVTNTYK